MKEISKSLLLQMFLPSFFFFFFLSVMKMDLDSVRREITLLEGAEQALGWDSQATPAMGVRKSEK